MFDTVPPGLLSDGAYIRNVTSPYTPSQVRQYLSHISWPDWDATGRTHDESSIEFDPTLENLARLMVHHCTTFPMDNTDLHYTPEHRMPIKPDELFDRMVLKGKGSYCFGQNGLFLGILRGLGYRAYGVAGRVLDAANTHYLADPASPILGRVYTTLVHLTLLVQPYSDPTLANVTFVVDMGFGGLGPLRPILFADGSDGNQQELPAGNVNALYGSTPRSCKGGWVWGAFPPVRQRIVRGAHYSSSLETMPGSSVAPLREWHMQVAQNTLDEWMTLYTFTEIEFFQRDIDAANTVASTFVDMPFANTVMCLKRVEVAIDDVRQTGVYDDDVEEDRAIMRTAEKVAREEAICWVAQWSLSGKRAVKKIGGKVVEEVRFGTERERVLFMKERIGLRIDVDGLQWALGRVAAV